MKSQSVSPMQGRWGWALVVLMALVTVGACTAAPSPTSTATVEPTATPTATSTAEPATSTPPAGEARPTPCPLAKVVGPTVPVEIPGYTELDPATDLHMTGSWQEIDLEGYRLEITGKVDRPLSLTYDELRCMPKIERYLDLVCPGFFEDGATGRGRRCSTYWSWRACSRA